MGRRESANPAQADALTKRSATIALLLLVPAPSLGIWLAMYVMPGGVIGQAAWGASKLWLVALPAIWCLWVDHQRWRIPSFKRTGLLLGAITGVMIFTVIYGAYLLIGHHWIDAAWVSEQAKSRGLNSPGLFIGMAIYWCTINSLLEEYVWRWFVFTRCAALTHRNAAILASALLFTIHHVFALAIYFDWRVTLPASGGVCIGGATWAWLYARYGNIYAAWLSHILADAAIFVIGYQLIFQG
ncbi:MAG: CPBP family intramembrane glutamic endopeptidase [Phycisphaerales bacterium]